ncbi:Uncharacterised protein [Clostridioides difficile]|nr:Uncharacterised protein [Clostridioides difficile]VFG94378.1 Uncharacterised protein [Clostridioides difficile]
MPLSNKLSASFILVFSAVVSMLSTLVFTSFNALTIFVLSVVVSCVVSPILVFSSVLAVSMLLVNSVLVVSILASKSCMSLSVAKITVGSTFRLILATLDTTNITFIKSSFTVPESAVGLYVVG